MGGLDDVWVGEDERIAASHQGFGMRSKSLSSKVLFSEVEILEHRPHTPIEDKNSLGKSGSKSGRVTGHRMRVVKLYRPVKVKLETEGRFAVGFDRRREEDS